MRIFIPKESPAEPRVSIVPTTAAKLAKLGAEVEVESGLGASIDATDDDYRTAGATISVEPRTAVRTAGMVLRVRKPSVEDVEILKNGCIHVSYLEPFSSRELVQHC